MIKVSEGDLGTAELVIDLEDCFIASCKLNNTTPEDLEYFRSYIWNLFALITNSPQMKKGKEHEL